MSGNQPKRALVLSGGGGRGAYECGVYKYLEEAGLDVDILVGTSIGAITAAAIASGRSAAELEAAWLQTRSRDIQRFLRLRPWRSIFDTTPWYRTLRRFIDFNRLAETDKHLLITATEVEGGALHVFDNRQIAITPAHIIASCSVPLVYPWTRVGRSHFWDGAVMANTPLASAIDAGADEVLVVLLSPVGARRIQLPRWPWDAIAVMLDMFLIATFENDIKQLERVNKLVMAGMDSGHRQVRCHVIAPQEAMSALRIFHYDPAVSKGLIEQGYQDARRVLESRPG
jgi:NTE family protein